ncbi:UV damage repair endonuclease UvdE [Bacillaceae bacterium JMAK1]|nr:UV damage repair endonuclease UvdE [Bacillaceae bacterium JMAK1]
MHIRFGFVSNAVHLYEASPAKTMTFSRFSSLDSKDALAKLHAITEENLRRTRRILLYAVAQQIPLYRFSSSIVPLATHDEVEFDYITPFKHLYEEIGDLVKSNQLRTSFHPNQFTLFTSPKQHVTDNAIKDLTYHYELSKAMNLHKEIRINIHIGGTYNDRSEAIKRFSHNIQSIPKAIAKQMTFENDDKTYTTTETLELCERHEFPMMFDYHHYMANHDENEDLNELLPRIFKTWERTGQPPKIHLSSPKSENAFRSHSDYVSIDFIRPLLDVLKSLDTSVDVMIEAKQKDRACLQLIEDITKIRGYKRHSGGMISR